VLGGAECWSEPTTHRLRDDLSKDDDHGGRYDYRRQPTAQHIIEKDGQRFIDDLVKPRSTAVRDLADPSGMVAKQTKDMTYDIA
jgi:hypothetical protein